MRFLLSIDQERFKQKPSNDRQYKDFTDRRGNPLSEFQVLGSRVGKRTEMLTIPELAQRLSEGCAWSPFVYKPCQHTKKVRRRSEFFKETQCIALDIDSGMSYQNIIDICQENDLHPNIIHETFSSSEKLRKYRVIFFLKKKITDPDVARSTIRTLLDLFPDADKASKDLARMFQGTDKKAELIQEDKLNQIDYIQEYLSDERSYYIPEDSSDEDGFKFSNPVDYVDEWLKLTPRQKEYIHKTMNKIISEIINYEDESVNKISKYELLFNRAEKCTGVKGLAGYLIYDSLTRAVEGNKHGAFDGWKYDYKQVILSAIQWKSQTTNIKSGKLFDIEKFEKKKNAKSSKTSSST